ncbi:beta-1,6-N-acetylglucosaminyltransferase [Psychrobacter immobilis]|uniref:beta-1,6-N-acetylglucosaminyltransferase n=1 Tax=Psychrobacter immobilis TaxID=498 RepID=UPI001919855E|nr:beta-1,6-N-acetylglucosaminyltransferase [Psychrobacter immobilis]
MKKIAYCIMAYDDINHLQQLINALGKNCEMFIHIDGYVDDSEFVNTIKNSNVHFLFPRIKISWAGISMVDTMIALLRQAIKFDADFSHYIFLSGSCYPIKSESYIKSIFNSNIDKSFIKFIDSKSHPTYVKQVKFKYIMDNPFRKRNRVTHNILRVVRRISLHTKIRNKWRDDIVAYKGSQWVALSDECGRYVIDYHDNNPWFRQMFKHTYAPDEYYIHTILGNSKLSKKCTGLQDFKYYGLDYLSNIHIVHISLAKWYSIRDWEEIKNSEKIFVRKVRSADGSELVDKINLEFSFNGENK